MILYSNDFISKRLSHSTTEVKVRFHLDGFHSTTCIDYMQILQTNILLLLFSSRPVFRDNTMALCYGPRDHKGVKGPSFRQLIDYS